VHCRKIPFRSVWLVYLYEKKNHRSAAHLVARRILHKIFILPWKERKNLDDTACERMEIQIEREPIDDFFSTADKCRTYTPNDSATNERIPEHTADNRILNTIVLPSDVRKNEYIGFKTLVVGSYALI
jgi:hypothetical protein